MWLWKHCAWTTLLNSGPTPSRIIAQHPESASPTQCHMSTAKMAWPRRTSKRCRWLRGPFCFTPSCPPHCGSTLYFTLPASWGFIQPYSIRFRPKNSSQGECQALPISELLDVEFGCRALKDHQNIPRRRNLHRIWLTEYNPVPCTLNRCLLTCPISKLCIWGDYVPLSL